MKSITETKRLDVNGRGYNVLALTSRYDAVSQAYVIELSRGIHYPGRNGDTGYTRRRPIHDIRRITAVNTPGVAYDPRIAQQLMNQNKILLLSRTNDDWANGINNNY